MGAESLAKGAETAVSLFKVQHISVADKARTGRIQAACQTV